MEEAGEPWCSGRGPPTNPGAEEPTSSLQTYTWITELNLLNKFGHLNVQRSNCRTNRHTVFPDLNWRRRHRKKKSARFSQGHQIWRRECGVYLWVWGISPD